MNGAAISVTALNKQFASLKVLVDLDLRIADQELVCILGPSGSGKSTLLNVIAGLETDYTGTVALSENRVGYLFQEPRLLPWLTAERNVDFALDSSNTPRARRADLKDHYFALVGLSGFRDYYPHQLSGGMRQRVALVRALCVEPGILLMDEPFGGLDELTARRLRVDLLRIWRETRKTILFVTHNAYEASYLADRVLVMAQGRIRDEIVVDVPRPRDYDDPAVFDVNRDVIRRFLALAEMTAEPLAASSP
ncbi:MAG: ABC transporter ATP-binding protein [Burkholderiales bacterium]